VKYIYQTSWTYYNLTIITTEKDQKHYLECYTIPDTAQLTREVCMPDTAVNLYKGVKIYFPALHKTVLAANKHKSCNSGTLSALLVSYLFQLCSQNTL